MCCMQGAKKMKMAFLDGLPLQQFDDLLPFLNCYEPNCCREISPAQCLKTISGDLLASFASSTKVLFAVVWELALSVSFEIP